MRRRSSRRRAGARVIRNAARRQGRGAGPRRARDGRGDRRVLRRELDVGAGRAAHARAQRSPTPTSRTSAAGSTSTTDDGRNKEGVYWRYELALRAAESRLDSVTGGNGSIYARAAQRLRRGRPALRPRPLAAVPDGAARAACRLRAGGERVREGDADERGRVPPQGADVRALLGDRRRGQDAAAAAAALSRRGALAPAPALRERRCCTSSLLGPIDRARSATAPIYAVALGLQLGVLARRASSASGIARYYVLVTWATVVALWNYLRRGVPATWEPAEGTR